MSLKSRLRGVFGTAIVWGGAFSLVSPFMILGQWMIGQLPSHLLTLRVFLSVMSKQFILGAAAGVLFATLMLLRERRHYLSSLSTRRVATWGFLGAGVLTAAAAGNGLLVQPIAAVLTFGVMGAGLAVGTLRIAQRAQVRDPLSVSELPQLRAGG